MLRLIFNDYQNTLLAIDHDLAMSEKMLLDTDQHTLFARLNQHL